jgi:sporadic carbohydrate cluster protein (TIGR04323 family)
VTTPASSAGFRGYIASRPIMGERTPQHVQNLVVRDYACRRGMTYLLSATEWAMDDCFMVLEEVLADLPRLDGIIAYSLFMLPADRSVRHGIWDRVLSHGKSFHAALESLKVSDRAGVNRVEDIWLARSVLSDCPSIPPRLSR